MEILSAILAVNKKPTGRFLKREDQNEKISIRKNK